MPETQTIAPKESISIQEEHSEMTIRIQYRKPVRCNLMSFITFVVLILLLPGTLIFSAKLAGVRLEMEPLIAWSLSAFTMSYVIIVAFRHSMSSEVYRLRSQQVEYFRDFHFFRGKIRQLSGQDLHARFERIGTRSPDDAMEDFVPGQLLIQTASGKITSLAVFDYKELEPLITKLEHWFERFRH